MKEEFEKYLSQRYPNSKVNSPFSLGGDIHIRFELGGEELENGTQERVKQAVERAQTIFFKTFPISNQEVFIIIYDFNDDSKYLKYRDGNYLYSLITQEKFDSFYNEIVKINSGFSEGEESWSESRLVIGKVRLTDVQIQKLIEGIANNEMGFEPAISQQIYFFDTKSGKGFYMYDDRGCFVFSDSADNIRDMYIELNDWIVDYHRPEIDVFFK